MNRSCNSFALVLVQLLLCALVIPINAQSPNSVFGAINQDIQLRVLIEALNVAKLAEKLDFANNITLFAPTNEGFITTLKDLGLERNITSRDPAEILEPYRRLAKARVINMKNILEYHIVPANLPTETIALGNPIQTNLTGISIKYDNQSNEFIDGNTNLENAKYFFEEGLVVDITASNGVYHLINRLLIPRNIDLERAKAVLNGEDLTVVKKPKMNNTQNSSNPCFPASAFVHTSDGRTVTMNQLSAGVPVRVSHTEQFSPVFLFSHSQHSGVYDFVQLTTASGHQITLSRSHYIYADRKLKAARAVQVGDTLRTLSGNSPVTVVRLVRDIGLFAPHAIHSGDIVVNGVLASSYTTAVHPRVAQLLLAPIRAVARMGLAKEPLGSTLYNGADRIANLLPSGPDAF